MRKSTVHSWLCSIPQKPEWWFSKLWNFLLSPQISGDSNQQASSYFLFEYWKELLGRNWWGGKGEGSKDTMPYCLGSNSEFWVHLPSLDWAQGTYPWEQGERRDSTTSARLPSSFRPQKTNRTPNISMWRSDGKNKSVLDLTGSGSCEIRRRICWHGPFNPDREKREFCVKSSITPHPKQGRRYHVNDRLRNRRKTKFEKH